MQPEFHEPTTRHRLIPPVASGRRKGFHRLVTGVLDGYNNETAFQGDYVPEARETDLAPGSIIVRKTPDSSIMNPTVTWHYAYVPRPGLPWEWSGPHDNTDFLTFRDAVRSALQGNASAVPDKLPPFLQMIWTELPPPPDIQNGVEFRQAIETVLAQPDVQGLTYDSYRGLLVVLTPGGQDPHAHRELLALPSTFASKIRSRMPYFMGLTFQWTDLEGSISLSDNHLFQAYFGMHQDFTQANIAQDPQPPDRAFIELLEKAMATATARLPAYRAQTWAAVEQSLKTLDLTLRPSDNPNERRIVLHNPT